MFLFKIFDIGVVGSISLIYLSGGGGGSCGGGCGRWKRMVQAIFLNQKLP